MNSEVLIHPDTASVSRWRSLKDRVRVGLLEWVERFVERRIVAPGRLEASSIRRVLIVQFEAGLQPLLRIAPLLSEMHARFSGVTVDVLVNGSSAASLFGCAMASNRLIDASLQQRSWLRVLRLAWRLRHSNYDLVMDLGPSRGAGRLAVAMSARRQALVVPGPDDKAWAYVMLSSPRHGAKAPVFVLRRSLVCEEQPDEIGYPPLALAISREEGRDADLRLREAGVAKPEDAPTCLLGMVASSSPASGLTDEWWRCFLETLRAQRPDITIVQVLRSGAQTILSDHSPTVSLGSPRQSLAVLGKFSALVVGDLSMLDLASASGAAVIGLHSIADPAVYTPFGADNHGIALEAHTAESAAAVVVKVLARTRLPNRVEHAMKCVQETNEKFKATSVDSGLRSGRARSSLSCRLAGVTKRNRIGLRGAWPRRRLGTSLALASRIGDRRSMVWRWIVGAALAISVVPAHAGGPFGIDHVIAYDNSGIWKRSYQTDLAVGTAVIVVGGALWVGDDTVFGDTLWRSVDALAFTAASTELMKVAFSRERPSQTTDPNQFFTGHGNQSFPSGEVAEIASAVTPFIVTYGQEHPAVYALALLPLYDAVARVKVHGHWQSDVIVGAAVGAGLGWYATSREHPFVVSVLPRGLSVGFKTTFQ